MKAQTLAHFIAAILAVVVTTGRTEALEETAPKPSHAKRWHVEVLANGLAYLGEARAYAPGEASSVQLRYQISLARQWRIGVSSEMGPFGAPFGAAGLGLPLTWRTDWLEFEVHPMYAVGPFRVVRGGDGNAMRRQGSLALGLGLGIRSSSVTYRLLFRGVAGSGPHDDRTKPLVGVGLAMGLHFEGVGSTPAPPGRGLKELTNVAEIYATAMKPPYSVNTFEWRLQYQHRVWNVVWIGGSASVGYGWKSTNLSDSEPVGAVLALGIPLNQFCRTRSKDRAWRCQC